MVPRSGPFLLPVPHLMPAPALLSSVQTHETSFNFSKALLLPLGFCTCKFLYLKGSSSLSHHFHFPLAKHDSLMESSQQKHFSSGGLSCCPQVRLGQLTTCFPSTWYMSFGIGTGLVIVYSINIFPLKSEVQYSQILCVLLLTIFSVLAWYLSNNLLRSVCGLK